MPQPSPSSRRPVLLAVLALACAAVAGCSTVRSLFPEERKEETQTTRLLQLQARNMRFADMYVGALLEAARHTEDTLQDANRRYALSGWLLAQANSAYTCATAENAVLGTLDLITLATLSHMVIEDAGIARVGDQARSLLAVHRDLEVAAWQLADGVLTPAQQADLRRLLVEWREKHPNQQDAPFVRFQEFVSVLPASSGKGKITLPTSLMGLVGLDPMAGLDPAVRQVEQSRLLAERAVYYAQRVPVLMDLQLDRSINRLAIQPGIQHLEQQSASLADSAARFSAVAEALPATLATEREALIRQLSETLVAQAAALKPVLVEMRSTLEAGSTAAETLDRTTRSIDALMARFERKPGEPPGRPFDITEYTRAAVEMANAARQLEQLVGSVGAQSPGLATVLQSGATEGRSLVDYFFVRVAWLIVLLCAGLLATLLLYRRFTPRGEPS